MLRIDTGFHPAPVLQWRRHVGVVTPELHSRCPEDYAVDESVRLVSSGVRVTIPPFCAEPKVTPVQRVEFGAAADDFQKAGRVLGLDGAFEWP